MYILVNSDIKIGKGKLAGQVGHAVAKMFYNAWNVTLGSKPLPTIEEYMQNHQKKIILYCSQGKLEELEKEGYIAIRDKGFTDLEKNTLTCVNLGIVNYDKFPEGLEWVRELKLCR